MDEGRKKRIESSETRERQKIKKGNDRKKREKVKDARKEKE